MKLQQVAQRRENTDDVEEPAPDFFGLVNFEETLIDLLDKGPAKQTVAWKLLRTLFDAENNTAYQLASHADFKARWQRAMESEHAYVKSAACGAHEAFQEMDARRMRGLPDYSHFPN